MDSGRAWLESLMPWSGSRGRAHDPEFSPGAQHDYKDAEMYSDYAEPRDGRSRLSVPTPRPQNVSISPFRNGRLPIPSLRRTRAPILWGMLAAALIFSCLAYFRPANITISASRMRELMRHSAPARNSITFSNGTVYDRPSSLKIVGVVFFGRRQFADILDCYLRRNLAVNGGLLDEVRFVMHTRNLDDRAWLQDLIQQHGLEGLYVPQYEDTEDVGWEAIGAGYRRIWGTMTDPDAIFVKIDDDVIYVEDHAIAEMVRTTIEHPEAYAVVPNIINNSFTYWYHHRNNAMFPYLPEESPPVPERASPKNSWRASELPSYGGNIPPGTEQFYRHDTYTYPIPFQGHRWLPLREGTRAQGMSHTPFNNMLPNPDGMDFERSSWALAAQSHYSFFENLERGTLSHYHFGTAPDGLQNLWYSHYSIQFFAISGKHLALVPFWDDTEVPDAHFHDDEILLTRIVPRWVNKPVLLASHAIVGHFAYNYDRAEIAATDILDRYRAYGNEAVCTASNQKVSFDAAPPLPPPPPPAEPVAAVVA